jgi:hypothetical protein
VKFGRDQHTRAPRPLSNSRKARISEAAACDVCLFRQPGGGAGLWRVFVVSPDWWSFQNHPRCRVFNDLASAVTAIMAGTQGEGLRLAKR